MRDVGVHCEVLERTPLAQQVPGILLVDAAPRILGTFDERLARRAADKLRSLGVEIEVARPRH